MIYTSVLGTVAAVLSLCETLCSQAWPLRRVELPVYTNVMKRHADSFRTFVLDPPDGRQAASKQEDKPSRYQDTKTAFRRALVLPDLRPNA